MLGITAEDCVSWCRRHGYLAPQAHGSSSNQCPTPSGGDQFTEVQLQFPTDPGRKVRLARDVIRWLAGSSELLVWVTVWDVYSFHQHTPLFTRLREALGEPRPLDEAPGHLLTVDELDDAISVLVTAFYFYWSCRVYSAQLRPVFFTTHDERCGFLVATGLDASTVVNSMSVWSPRILP